MRNLLQKTSGETMTNYTKGRAFEYQVKKILEKDGQTVWRTAGSHSPVDLIAVYKDTFGNMQINFIQCKTGKKINKDSLLKEVKKSMSVIPCSEKRFAKSLFIKEDHKPPEFKYLDEPDCFSWIKVSEVFK